MARRCMAFAAAAVAVVAASPSSSRQQEKSTGSGWMLAHHSFNTTLTYEDRLGDWLSSAGTMALRDRIQLMPPVADRHGVFWSEKAVQTGDYEVSFDFSVKGPRRTLKDGVFAFWISPDNFTADYDEAKIVEERNWTRGLEIANLVFCGNKPTFKGLALVFSGLDQRKTYRPSVTGIWNGDIGKERALYRDFPIDGAASSDIQTKFVDYRRSLKPIKVKVRVRAGSLVGSMMVYPGNDWIEVFRMPVTVKPGSYFGFTGLTGSASTDEADEVTITKVSTENFDETMIGEVEEKEDAMLMGEDMDEWMKTLSTEKMLIDQKDQKYAVDKLTKMLKQHVDRYSASGKKAKEDLAILEGRLMILDRNFNELVVKVQASGADGQKMDASTLKAHVMTISERLRNDRSAHDAKLSEVEKAAKVLKYTKPDGLGASGRRKFEEATIFAASVEGQLVKSSSTTTFFLVVLILVALGLGGLFLNRMRYYEKKHVF